MDGAGYAETRLKLGCRDAGDLLRRFSREALREVELPRDREDLNGSRRYSRTAALVVLLSSNLLAHDKELPSPFMHEHHGVPPEYPMEDESPLRVMTTSPTSSPIISNIFPGRLYYFEMNRGEPPSHRATRSDNEFPDPRARSRTERGRTIFDPLGFSNCVTEFLRFRAELLFHSNNG